MRLQFCGADRTVTGSCHLVEIHGLSILLDLGMYQGPRDEARRINHWLPESTGRVDAVILSHGHLDHCGKLPVLIHAGYTGPIYCTPATAGVARVVLEDSAEIQQEDAAFLNQRSRGPGEPIVKPLYTRSDVLSTLRLFRKVGYKHKTDLGRGISFTFFDAGHILGSAYVLLEWEEGGAPRSLLFTADIGRYGSPIICDPHPLAGPVDLVITESTYGNRAHAPMEQVGPELLDAVKFCIERRSRLIVPSFAVGRTQTILWYVQKFIAEGAIPPIPVFVDSPMGVEASHVHSEFRDYYDDETRAMIGEKDLFGLSRVNFASSSQDSRMINKQAGPCVIIASSPTCEFGRVLHHVAHSVEHFNDLIVFVGWTPPGTLGRRLQDGQKRARIFDRWYDVHCQVRTIHGLSAHADGDELIRFLRPTIRKETTFYVVHGEPASAEALAARLVAEGAGNCLVPAMETSLVEFSGTGAPAAPQKAGTATDE